MHKLISVCAQFVCAVFSARSSICSRLRAEGSILSMHCDAQLHSFPSAHWEPASALNESFCSTNCQVYMIKAVFAVLDLMVMVGLTLTLTESTFLFLSSSQTLSSRIVNTVYYCQNTKSTLDRQHTANIRSLLLIHYFLIIKLLY